MKFPLAKCQARDFFAMVALALISSGCRLDESDKISRVVVTPKSAVLTPLSDTLFSVRGVTNAGDSVEVEAAWFASSGTIDLSGSYTAPSAPGTYVVTAFARQFVDTAFVVVEPHPVVQLSVEPSSVTVQPGGTFTFGTSARNTIGQTVPTVPSWTATGGAITQSGFWSAPGVPGTYTIQAASNNLTATATATVPDDLPPPTLTNISRDAGSAAGGASLILTGTHFFDPISVRFGTVEATVTARTANSLTVTTPAHPVSTVPVMVSTGGGTATLPTQFDFLPAPSKVYGEQNFESGSLAPFTASTSSAGKLEITTSRARSGVRAVRTTVDTTGAASVVLTFPEPNPMLNEPNGVYVRWFMQVPRTSIENVLEPSDQIKFHLLRTTTGSGQPGFMMLGIGSAFGGDSLRLFIDNGIVNVPNGRTGIKFGDGVWVEIQIWNKRVLGMGSVTVWLNGKKITSAESTRLGSDDATLTYRFRAGIAHAEHPRGPVEVFIDDVKVTNGFIDP